METFYHGTSRVFNRFDLSHVLEGDGKVKFGYGVYVTSHYRSAAHYSAAAKGCEHHYVYTVEIPDLTADNYIAFKEAVHPDVLKRSEEKLGVTVPDKAKTDGKLFRKFLAKQLTGSIDLEGEKAASQFLLSIGVEFIVWPYNWKNPALGTNRAVLDDSKVVIRQIDEVDLDAKEQLVEGSERLVKQFQ